MDPIFAIISRNIGEILRFSNDFFYGCKNEISTDFPLISEKTAKISSEILGFDSRLPDMSEIELGS